MALFFTNCGPDDVDDNPVPRFTKGLYVLHEGNFQRGNASLSYINLDSGSVENEVFKRTNGRSLGDVGQSISLWKDELFLVINNSGSVEIVNPSTFKSIGTISGFTSPRYLNFISSDKALVSDLYANKIYHINQVQRTIKNEIELPGWSEAMVTDSESGNTFITNMDSPKVYVLNKELQVSNSIEIGGKSEEIFQDQNGQIWVLRMSDVDQKIAAAWFKINPHSLNFEKVLEIDGESTAYAASSFFNRDQNTCWFILFGKVWELNTQTNQLKEHNLAQDGETFYSICASNTQLFIADAKNYNQKGQVHVYQIESMKRTASYDVGIIPSAMVYVEE
ncbi:MAG: hypothetical protein KDC92_09675 [Bacteroidetes bacterium]|nr:hypothetical protein [Bacteroidota bacterium]